MSPRAMTEDVGTLIARLNAGWSFYELSVAIYLDALAQWTGRDQRLLWPPERELARRDKAALEARRQVS